MAFAPEWSNVDEHFLVAMEGQVEGKRKVYMFGSGGSMKGEVDYRAKPPAEKSIMNIFAHSLVDGTTEKVLPASIVTEACNWVLPGKTINWFKTV
ncbi:hypothetical protein E2562_011952 [Oryza meyeriana var. granulata]|uniref:Uncharacterized protein n=1 Tax=Oryza meyeriana var. granulata TaxID=110450 RepID=A0A6G1F6U5_9ORYZ|nr:hypothetical protein E2562_011952 [Oryza meyeriana var. granulata]